MLLGRFTRPGNVRDAGTPHREHRAPDAAGVGAVCPSVENREVPTWPARRTGPLTATVLVGAVVSATSEASDTLGGLVLGAGQIERDVLADALSDQRAYVTSAQAVRVACASHNLLKLFRRQRAPAPA